MRKAGFSLLAILVLLIVLLAYWHGSQEVNARQALLRALGVSPLNLLSPCAAARNMADDIYGCLTDIPGGYSIRPDCDAVGFPRAFQLHTFTMRLVKAEGSL